MATKSPSRIRRSPRSIADHLETGHAILCRLQAEAHALGVLRRLPEEAARERALVVGSLVAILGFLVAGLSEYNFGDSEVVMVAWALMALPWVVASGSRDALAPG